MRLRQAVLSTSLKVTTTGVAQLLPAGDFSTRDGRPGPGRKWKLDDVRGRMIAAALAATALATPVVIDYEHQTLHKEANGKPAPAAGWIKGASWIDGEGLSATVDWTPRAKAAIDAGEYRYISPVILFDEETEEVKGVALAALTNYPAIVGMSPVVAALSTQFSTPLNPEEPDMALLASLIALLGLQADATEAAALTAITALKAKTEKPPEKTVLSAALTGALGLAAGADETAALTAITTLKTAGAAPDPVTLQTIQAMQGQIAALTAQLGEDKVTKAVDAALAEHKLLPAQREWAMSLGKKDFAALTAFISSAPAIPGLGGQTHGSAPAGGEATAALTADASKLMAGFGLTPEQWAKAKPAATT